MSYKDTIIATNPFAYFRFNEPLGSIIDDIIGGVSFDLGSIEDGLVTYSQTGLINDPDTSMHFFKSSARGVLSLDYSAAVSFEGWFLSDAIVSNESVIFSNYLNDLDWTFRFQAINFDGSLNLQVNTPSGVVDIPVTGIVFNDGNKHHFVVTSDGSVVFVYIDSVLVGSSTGLTLVDSASKSFSIGNEYAPLNTKAFNSVIDEFSVYAYTLTQSQVLVHYNAGINPPTTLVLYNDIIDARNPIAYYRLGEAAGSSVAIDSVNGIDAAYLSGDMTAGVLGLLVDDTDTAYLFDPADGPGVPTTPQDNLFAFGTADFAIELFIQPTTVNTLMGVVAIDNYATGFTSHFSAVGDFVIVIAGAAIVIPSAIHGMVDGQAYQVVIVRRSGSIFVYVDSAEVWTTGLAGIISGLNAGLEIGNWTLGPDKFDGVIDELSIYDRALTVNEIIQSYNAGITPPVGDGGLFASIINVRSI